MQGNACMHFFKKKYDCVKCWPDRQCDCNSGKHYKNCCKQYPKALQHKKIKNVINTMPTDQEMKSGLEKAEKECVQAPSIEKPCACGQSTIDRCLKCRIEKKVSEMNTSDTFSSDKVTPDPPLAYTSPCPVTMPSEVESKVDKMCTEYLLSRCHKILFSN